MAASSLTALLHSEANAGAGAYNSFDRWSTALRGDAASDGARLVTVHEALHAALNDTTAYGVLLAACSALVQTERSSYEQELARLVGQCRGVHEAFATFQSLWLVVAGDLSYLDGYPRYQRWYRDARDLVPLPDSSRRKEMMLEAAARACMQAPVLDRLIAGPDNLSHAWAPPARDRPDERFAMLHRTADANFWSHAWARCAAAVSGTPLWAALEASDHDVTSRPETYDDAYAEPLATCAHLLYDSVARLLGEQGADTLDYDGHRSKLDEVVAIVEAVSPAARGLLIPSSDKRTVREESYEMWRRERLVLRDRPLLATVRRFSEVVADRQIPALLSGGGEKLHVFASVRPADRLVDQFALDQSAQRWLAEQGSAPIVTVRSTSDRSEAIDLTVLDDPYELVALSKSVPKRLAVHVNVSLACLGDRAWRDRWSRALRRTRLTGLVDLSSMAQLKLWHDEGQRFSYAQATVHDVQSVPAELMVWLVGDTNLPLLLVCTSVTGDVLKKYIEDTYPTAQEDPEVIVRRQATIELATSHLLFEEYYFDLAAYIPERPQEVAK
jgi:hypothetical protein